ncbi:5-(carboxyamino)imidazole ribonucleotide synthase [Virgibacillus salexigens]|uniref:5-(carboxyamino)imidazole ribonucleotide synthase n=1 Tax=Virgibacillus TaxID=84406 RepID=UPI00136F4FAB|nr:MULTISPECIES: 5-(carboxyamino)imidazole ribonucleotide synthase [Virgibacillus]MYL43166.1 5-(carboxyamino)imidazole ribonucleotide synthase [Virgibacillus massiliensis]
MRNTTNIILPGQTIGIIGGGQLGRMMAIAAKYMGYRVNVLDPTAACPAAQVADHQIIADYADLDAIQELTALSDVITYEFENVDLHAAAYIEQQGKLPQGSFALEVTQNREKEKTLMEEANLPVPPFSIVKNGAECEQALADFPFPAVIKTCSGGYDGKGQLKIENREHIAAAIEFAEQHAYCIVEQWIPFDKEISVVFTRSLKGEITFFPVAENDHKNHILYQTTVPANITNDVEKQAYEAVEQLAEHMDIVGTFAVELFVKGDGIYLNEMAPRPHNSGHYTIEACTVSQFTQHIRAICNLPLTEVRLLESAVMINILGEDLEAILQAMTKASSGFVHLYGKDEAKSKRKMGHITFIGATMDKVNEQIQTFEEAKQ